MHEDDTLLDAIERQTLSTVAFIKSATRRLLEHDDWLRRLERTMAESVRDRARLHEDTERETEARKENADQLRREIAQLRLWFFFILASVGALVFVFVLAIVFGGK